MKKYINYYECGGCGIKWSEFKRDDSCKDKCPQCGVDLNQYLSELVEDDDCGDFNDRQY